MDEILPITKYGYNIDYIDEVLSLEPVTGWHVKGFSNRDDRELKIDMITLCEKFNHIIMGEKVAELVQLVKKQHDELVLYHRKGVNDPEWFKTKGIR